MFLMDFIVVGYLNLARNDSIVASSVALLYNYNKNNRALLNALLEAC